jgi:hypothetical protein
MDMAKGDEGVMDMAKGDEGVMDMAKGDEGVPYDQRRPPDEGLPG